LSNSRSHHTTGISYGLAAYILWGLLPIYWQWLEGVGADEILAHRGLWSLIVCLIFLAFTRRISIFIATIKNVKTFFTLTAATILLTINWGVYIWSVTVDRVVEAALGYYITPLVAVGFGVFMLKERLRTLQKFSITIAALGVALLTLGYGTLPWIALVLAASWGGYGLIKKRLNLGALETLSIETLIALPVSLGYLFYLAQGNQSDFGSSPFITLLLIGGGLATVIPLLFFNGAATRLPLSTVGILQYITPTIMFFIGVGVNKEDMSPIKLIGFISIWIALVIFGKDLLKSTGSINNSAAEIR